MTALLTTEWTIALDKMTNVLNQTLRDLDRYEADWAMLTDTPTTAAAPDLLLSSLENRLAQWDDRLDASVKLAESVEKQLVEKEAAIERWHEVFVRWRELIQREVDASGFSTG